MKELFKADDNFVELEYVTLDCNESHNIKALNRVKLIFHN